MRVGGDPPRDVSVGSGGSSEAEPGAGTRPRIREPPARCGRDGRGREHRRPGADTQGEVMMVLNERSDADAGFLRLLSDPTSTGTFVL